MLPAYVAGCMLDVNIGDQVKDKDNDVYEDNGKENDRGNQNDKGKEKYKDTYRDAYKGRDNDKDEDAGCCRFLNHVVCAFLNHGLNHGIRDSRARYFASNKRICIFCTNNNVLWCAALNMRAPPGETTCSHPCALASFRLFSFIWRRAPSPPLHRHNPTLTPTIHPPTILPKLS